MARLEGEQPQGTYKSTFYLLASHRVILQALTTCQRLTFLWLVKSFTKSTLVIKVWMPKHLPKNRQDHEGEKQSTPCTHCTAECVLVNMFLYKKPGNLQGSKKTITPLYLNRSFDPKHVGCMDQMDSKRSSLKLK